MVFKGRRGNSNKVVHYHHRLESTYVQLSVISADHVAMRVLSLESSERGMIIGVFWMEGTTAKRFCLQISSKNQESQLTGQMNNCCNSVLRHLLMARVPQLVSAWAFYEINNSAQRASFLLLF